MGDGGPARAGAASMDESYHGFAEKPFSPTPDPTFLFQSESHARAVERLAYAIDRREGFAVVTGERGTGKTTLCRALLERANRGSLAALLPDGLRSAEAVLTAVLQEFGVVSRGIRTAAGPRPSRQELVNAFDDFLGSLAPLDARAVLVVDEAQGLPALLLEQVRILSTLEANTDQRLQIVLVGQSSLLDLLGSPELRQLDQRVSTRFELEPLTADEVGAYVSHRLAIARASRSVVFTSAALQVVHRYSGGVPRVVNLLCDRALDRASSARTGRVNDTLVVTAAGELGLEPVEPRSWIDRVLGRRAT